MRHVRSGLVLAVLFFAAVPAVANDEAVMLPIADAMNMPEARQRLSPAVTFYFGTQGTPRVVQSFGNFVANPKTNAFAKTEGRACEWAFLSALRSLQERAESVGANAIINVQSYYKKHEFISNTQYECHKGFLIAGVALRGDVVRFAGR